jgi:hypothetical protein
MDPSRPNRVLEDWSAVAGTAQRPQSSPRPVEVRGGLPMATLAAASLVIIAVAIAGPLLGRRDSDGVVGSSPSMSVASAVPSTAASQDSHGGFCQPDDMDARIVSWDGAAGSRIAQVELTNTGSTTCGLETMAKPRLVSGRGAVLIDGKTPRKPAVVAFASGAVVRTLVDASNYCGADPELPVSVAFVTTYEALFVATALSPTDATVPPCNGAPGSAGSIAMHPWAP